MFGAQELPCVGQLAFCSLLIFLLHMLLVIKSSAMLALLMRLKLLEAVGSEVGGMEVRVVDGQESNHITGRVKKVKEIFW